MLSTILANTSGSFWMPQRASTYADDVDGLFNFIFWLSAFFFLLIVVLLVVFVWRYRHRGGGARSGASTHSTALEVTWTIIPTVLVVIIFHQGFKSYMNMTVEPPNAYEIQVTARMWSWSFTYPNGHTDSELHLPVNTPIRLVLTSDDVIHSVFIPQFRAKRDAVPGRYNKMWFEADQTGEFDLYCAEYCGLNHSTMRAKVVVHDSSGFRNWLEQAANWETRMTPLEAGKMLFEKRGCTQCHSVDGATLQGPTLKDVFGAEVPHDRGKRLVADENYIRESILDPGAKIVDGFSNVMPSYKGSFKDRDIDAIIMYLKSISSHYRGDLSSLRAGPATQPALQTEKTTH